jgi:hypothetical protein
VDREDIIRMAVEVGARYCANPDKGDVWEIRDIDLERFAVLVAAHERERITNAAFAAAEKADNYAAFYGGVCFAEAKLKEKNSNVQ